MEESGELAKVKANAGLLKAATVSVYVLGVLDLVLAITGIVLGYLILSPSGLSGSTIYAVGVIYPAVGIPISIVYGYYIFRVGKELGVRTLYAVAIFTVLTAVSSLILILGITELERAISEHGPVGLIEGIVISLMGVFGLLSIFLMFGLVFGGLYFISMILLWIGSNNMKNKTGISTFGKAGLLAILGIITLGLTIPFAIFAFARGLDVLRKQ